MRKSFKILTTLIITLISSTCWSETISINDLVKIEDHYHHKLSGNLFTGSVSGRHSGEILKGKKVGRWVEYNVISEVTDIGNYLDGLREGEWKQFFEPNDQLSRIAHFKNGRLDGPMEKYHVNGNLISRVTFQRECLAGLGEFFYPNGNIKSRGQYKNLEMDCLSLKSRGEYEGIILFHNGKKDGQWSYYSVLGELEKLEVWEDGVQLK